MANKEGANIMHRAYEVGYMNAKVGKGAVTNIGGSHGLGERNETGYILVQFCEENQLVICNTLFKQHHRRLYMYTWTSPADRVRNQIGFIMIQRRWRNSILNCRTLPGVDL